MEQPVSTPDPAAATPAAPPAAPPAGQPPRPEPVEGFDVQQIKTMLNLPETATDIEVITALAELVAGLQQKYEALLADAVALEDKVANRDLDDFKDLITNETQDYWREQLLANRDATLAVLGQLRATKAPPAPAPQAAAPRVPLRNRLADQPRTLATLGEAAAGTPAVAVKIRNRAMEIRKTERVPFAEAFARAEKEVT